MTLMPAKLGAVFAGPPVPTEAEAIDYMAGAFTDFFSDAVVAGIAALPAPLAPAELAFRAAAVGLSQPGLGAAKIQAAITAYWTAAMLAAPAVWITVPPIVPASGLLPPGLGGIAAAMASVFPVNNVKGITLSQASTNLGAAVLPTQSGATVTLGPPPPSGTPGIPVL